jgi:hypothetical protein
MLNGDVLHPFAPQSYMWDDLWLEQDGAAQFVIVTKRHEKEQAAEVDKAAVREVCTFFMRMKLNTRLFQRKVGWCNPGQRKIEQPLTLRLPPLSKQQRRFSAGIGRDSSESRTGLAVE